MKKLYDKIYRQTLIARYLDADTSIEEEKALADFYRHCKAEDLTEEELGIRSLMLGLENYTQTSESQASESNDLTNETKAQQVSMPIPRKSPSKNSSIRLSAILLAAAMIAGLIFLVFPVKEMFSSKTKLVSLVPTTQVVRSNPSSTDESHEGLNPAEEMERQDSLFLATTKDIVVPSSHNGCKTEQQPSLGNAHKAEVENRVKRKKLENKRKEEREGNDFFEKKGENLSNDLNHFYEVASLALPSAEQLIIDQQGDNIVITTTDEDGNTQHFTIDTSDANEGLYQIHPLAQLNE